MERNYTAVDTLVHPPTDNMSQENADMTLSDVVTQLMNEHGETTLGLANKLNMNQPTLHRIVTGAVRNPDFENVAKIAKYFKVDAQALLNGKIVPLNSGVLPAGIRDPQKEMPEDLLYLMEYVASLDSQTRVRVMAEMYGRIEEILAKRGGSQQG